MGNRRFSGTTLVTVLLALVALYFVGTKVTPPPAAPPKEAPPQTVATTQVPQTPQATPAAKPDPTAAMDRATRIKEMAKEMKEHPVTPKKKFNPTSIEVESSYWQQNRDGQTGVNAMEAKVEKANEAANKSTGPATKQTPGSLKPETPNSSAPAVAPSK